MGLKVVERSEKSGVFGSEGGWAGGGRIVEKVKRMFHINGKWKVDCEMLKSRWKVGKVFYEVALMFLMMSSTVSR